MSTSETPKIQSEQAPNQRFLLFLYTPFGEIDTTPQNLIVIKGQNEAIGVSLEFNESTFTRCNQQQKSQQQPWIFGTSPGVPDGFSCKN